MRLLSWIPPTFVWTTAPGLFAVRVPIGVRDLVKFVATGREDIYVNRTRREADALATLTRGTLFAGQVQSAGWAVLRDAEDATQSVASVYCYGVFVLPGKGEVLVLVGIEPPSEGVDGWLPEAARMTARELLAAHQAAEVEVEKKIERRKEENEGLFHDSVTREKVNTLLSMDPFLRHPVLTAEGLLPHLPSAVMFTAAASASLQSVETAALKAIAESGWPLPRDGVYAAVPSVPMGQRRVGLATWAPYIGPPPYLEVRAAVQRRLARALLNPRLNHSGRPEFDGGPLVLDEAAVVLEGPSGGTLAHETLDGLQLDDSNFGKRVEAVRRDLKAEGFEAIAWFQPYHSWTEETWGIYFDARKLDALALSLLEDFRSRRIARSQSDAACLALGLTHAHELFHARGKRSCRGWKSMRSGLGICATSGWSTMHFVKRRVGLKKHWPTGCMDVVPV